MLVSPADHQQNVPIPAARASSFALPVLLTAAAAVGGAAAAAVGGVGTTGPYFVVTAPVIAAICGWWFASRPLRIVDGQPRGSRYLVVLAAMIVCVFGAQAVEGDHLGVGAWLAVGGAFLVFAAFERAPVLAWASAAVVLCAMAVGVAGPDGTARVMLLELINAAAFAAAGWQLVRGRRYNDAHGARRHP